MFALACCHLLSLSQIPAVFQMFECCKGIFEVFVETCTLRSRVQPWWLSAQLVHEILVKTCELTNGNPGKVCCLTNLCFSFWILSWNNKSFFAAHRLWFFNRNKKKHSGVRPVNWLWDFKPTGIFQYFLSLWLLTRASQREHWNVVQLVDKAVVLAAHKYQD